MCLSGARAVQRDILEKHPTAKLKVYTVWFSMLAGDSRSGWHSGAMPDPRVTHLWDEKHIASQWFSQHIDGEQGYVWDAYFLYGPEAKWDGSDGAPTPLVSSGGTVQSRLGDLEASITPLLTQDSKH